MKYSTNDLGKTVRITKLNPKDAFNSNGPTGLVGTEMIIRAETRSLVECLTPTGAQLRALIKEGLEYDIVSSNYSL